MDPNEWKYVAKGTCKRSAASSSRASAPARPTGHTGRASAEKYAHARPAPAAGMAGVGLRAPHYRAVPRPSARRSAGSKSTPKILPRPRRLGLARAERTAARLSGQPARRRPGPRLGARLFPGPPGARARAGRGGRSDARLRTPVLGRAGRPPAQRPAAAHADRPTLALLCERVERVQEPSGARFCWKTCPLMCAFAPTPMSEAEFMAALARRTGCGCCST